MLHAPPDLDHLRTITNHALHGHTALGTHHDPTPLVTIAAAHLDVLLRSINPDRLPDATKTHNRDLNRAAHHTRTITAIATAVDTLTAAVTKNDTTSIDACARNLTRLAATLKETHRP